jgi:hypothetical protein
MKNQKKAINQLLILLSIITFFSCQKYDQDSLNKETTQPPAPAPYFKDNFINYVNDRFNKEVEKVDADSISGFVVLVDKNLPESEFHGKIEQFLIKGTAEFFTLVNGLWTLELTIKSQEANYILKINKSEYEKFFKIKFKNFEEQNTYSQFLNKEHNTDTIKNFMTKFVKIEKSTAS